MFSQRKSFLKGKLFYITLLALFAFGIWVNQAPIVTESPDDVKADTKYPVTSQDALNQGDNGYYDIMDNIIGNGNIDTPDDTGLDIETTDDSESAEKGYYLIKEVDGVIMIFYYNEEGKESLIRETDIAFSLLSIADQALFQKGVIKHSSEELDELLQDFES